MTKPSKAVSPVAASHPRGIAMTAKLRIVADNEGDAVPARALVNRAIFQCRGPAGFDRYRGHRSYSNPTPRNEPAPPFQPTAKAKGDIVL